MGPNRTLTFGAMGVGMSRFFANAARSILMAVMKSALLQSRGTPGRPYLSSAPKSGRTR